MNLLSPSEMEEVWFPEVIFENIASEEDWREMQWSEEYNIVRNSGGDFEPVDDTEVSNAFMFAGNKNKQKLNKEFTVIWICNFNMMWYPFDTQHCEMMFKVMNKFRDYVELTPATMIFSGPEHLTQYVVKGSRMCRTMVGSAEGVDVEITLGRPLISNILTVFIPTIIQLSLF